MTFFSDICMGLAEIDIFDCLCQEICFQPKYVRNVKQFLHYFQHEESPVDSAYGSDQKKDIMNNINDKKYITENDNRSMSSRSDISTPSTVKKAESMDYDSVMW